MEEALFDRHFQLLAIADRDCPTLDTISLFAMTASSTYFLVSMLLNCGMPILRVEWLIAKTLEIWFIGLIKSKKHLSAEAFKKGGLGPVILELSMGMPHKVTTSLQPVRKPILPLERVDFTNILVNPCSHTILKVIRRPTKMFGNVLESWWSWCE